VVNGPAGVNSPAVLQRWDAGQAEQLRAVRPDGEGGVDVGRRLLD
jgi:hypothetical protein